MTAIKFGADGWHALFAKDFTVGNLARVAEATAQWLMKYKTPTVVLGHETQFGGELFVLTACKVLASHSIKVYLAKGFVSMPMVSLGTVKKNADLGIVITVSQNAPAFNGFKLKGANGGPLLPAKIQEIENLIPERNTIDLDNLTMREFEEKGLIEYIDLETICFRHIEVNANLHAIRESELRRMT